MDEETINNVHTLRIDLEDKYDVLVMKTRDMQHTQQTENYARMVFEEAKRAVLLAHANNPKDLGANEAAREATILVKVYEESDTLHKAQQNTEVSRYELSIAQLRVDSLRAQLRCYEVIAGLTGSK